MISKICKELILKSHGYDPIYEQGLANHLPMTLLALDKMGKNYSNMEYFFNSYISKLSPMRTSSAEINEEDILIMGKSELFPQFVIFYKNELEKYGISDTLKKHLPSLLPGIGASAFHGLIRLSYAIQSGIIEEVAYSMAFWASEYEDFGPITEPISGTIKSIINNSMPFMTNFKFNDGLIIDRMKEVSHEPKIQKFLLQPETINIDLLAKTVIKQYKESEDFTILHGVTGCHALRIILHYIEEKEIALRYYWKALLLAILTTAKSPRKYKDIENNSTIDEILLKTSKTEDAHTIKFVYTCLEENETYGYKEYMDCINLKFNKIV